MPQLNPIISALQNAIEIRGANFESKVQAKSTAGNTETKDAESFKTVLTKVDNGRESKESRMKTDRQGDDSKVTVDEDSESGNSGKEISENASSKKPVNRKQPDEGNESKAEKAVSSTTPRTPETNEIDQSEKSPVLIKSAVFIPDIALIDSALTNQPVQPSDADSASLQTTGQPGKVESIPDFRFLRLIETDFKASLVQPEFPAFNKMPNASSVPDSGALTDLAGEKSAFENSVKTDLATAVKSSTQNSVKLESDRASVVDRFLARSFEISKEPSVSISNSAKSDQPKIPSLLNELPPLTERFNSESVRTQQIFSKPEFRTNREIPDKSHSALEPSKPLTASDAKTENGTGSKNDSANQKPFIQVSKPEVSVNQPQTDPRIAVVRNIFSFGPEPQAAPTVSGGAVIDSISQVRASKTETLPNRIPQTDYETVVKDVKDAVIRMASDGRGQARIVLHPPELGELVVRISSTRDGVMRAEFHTFSPLVREALEAGLNRLTDALKAEGLTLERAEVFLNMNPGAQGNGTSEGFETTDNSGSDFGYDEPGFGESSINPITTEILPEGCTICVYA